MAVERRILVLASKPMGRAPSQRYRFEQWAPHLASKHAIILDLAPFESEPLADLLYEPGHIARKAMWTAYDFVRRAAVLPRASGYDAILVHREAALIGPAIFERLIARIRKPLIFDFDDAIWSTAQVRTNELFGHLHFYGKTSTTCRLASAVTTGNEYLANYARKRNDNVHVIPSSIELADYPIVREPAGNTPFVVCWTGSASTLAYFEHARRPLEQLAARLPLAVKVVCSKPPDRPIAGAEMHFVPWSSKGEAQDVGDCHVGIMPLPDNEVTRGKGGMKALQYMAAGRPVVLSPVGVNAQIVADGVNGYLANTDDEWVMRLLELARSSDLRVRMGAEARLTVEREYSAAGCAAKFAKAVATVL